MNKEQLKTKIYRKREWNDSFPLFKNLTALETQVQDLSKFIIEDIIKVDEESEKRLTYFKENDFEQFKTDINIDSEGLKSEIAILKDGVASNTSLIQQTATDIDLKITDGNFLVSQINLGIDGVSISGKKIKLNENFSVDENGNICVKKISASLLTAGIIDAEKITVRNLKADSITTGSIITEKIEDGAITTDKIAIEGLDAKVISAGIIDAQKVSIINLSAENITVGKINGEQITPGTITGTQIANGIITTDKIHVNGISADKITTGTLSVGNELTIRGIINGNLAEFTNIKAENITVGTINGTQIGNGAIGDNHITDLSADKLTAGTIDANIINVNNLNATNINSGTLNASRLNLGTEFTADSDGNLSLNTISANKISSGEIDATLIKVKNLNADEITVGKINGANIGDEQIGNNHMKEIVADKIVGGTISSSAFITSTENETTTITGGVIKYSRNGHDITTFRNIRSGVISTNSSGSGVVEFTGLNTNLSVLTTIKSFNIMENLRSLHCYAELIDIARNAWKFTIGGTQTSVESNNEMFQTRTFSKECNSITLNKIEISSLDNQVGSLHVFKNPSVFTSEYIINLKITYQDGLENSKIIYNSEHNIPTFVTLLGGNCKIFLRPITIPINQSFTTNQSSLKNFTISIVPTSRKVVVKSSSVLGTSIYDTIYCDYANFELVHTNVSFTINQLESLIGDGEVQYTAIEQ